MDWQLGWCGISAFVGIVCGVDLAALGGWGSTLDWRFGIKVNLDWGDRLAAWNGVGSAQLVVLGGVDRHRWAGGATHWIIGLGSGLVTIGRLLWKRVGGGEECCRGFDGALVEEMEEKGMELFKERWRTGGICRTGVGGGRG